MSLYKRLTETGTIPDPGRYPDARFSLPSTINWMCALAKVVESETIDGARAKAFYLKIQPRSMSDQEENTIYEQLLFSLHQSSAIRALRLSPNKADVARVGIISWYYGVYAAASAMITAQDSSFQDDHTSTARVWDRQISSASLILPPFNMRISSLVKKIADTEICNLSTGQKFDLAGTAPVNIDEARGACLAYLSGSVSWYRWKAGENIKASKEFGNLKVTGFRTKAARKLRDDHLKKRSVGFLHQALRYRGKANYRDAIFLGYGPSVDARLSNYINDLSSVLDAFVTLAGIFCSKRLGTTSWQGFVADLESKKAFSLRPDTLWE